MKKCFPCFLSLLLLLMSVTAVSAAAGKEKGGEPIYIRADRLQTETASRTAVFAGNVVARQDDLVIYADRMVVTYSEGARDVEKVECTGKVRILQGSRTGTSSRAVYENSLGRIILTGTPRVYQGDDLVTGSEIIYYLADQRTEVTGTTDSRVEVIIHPRAREKDGGAKP